MQRFIIERDIPGAAQLSAQELADITAKSTATAAALGVPYRWVTSYVAGDRCLCVHEADDESVIREHSRRAGYPVTSVTAVSTEIGPG